jgi:hypothetical protein
MAHLAAEAPDAKDRVDSIKAKFHASALDKPISRSVLNLQHSKSMKIRYSLMLKLRACLNENQRKGAIALTCFL